MKHGLHDTHVVIALASGQAPRLEKYQGDDYLVVPVVALMEGVIHAVNAKVPEFVPAKALARAAHTWNGRPLVINHPTNSRGQQISANDPRILEERGFGFIAKAAMSNANKLGMEAWCSVRRLEALGQHELLSDLRASKPIEVSVGAAVDTDDVSGEYNGKRYAAVWTEIIGDHLAFLPGGLGACSLEMGCGTGRMAGASPVLHSFTEHGITYEGIADMRTSYLDPETLRCLRDIPQSERDKMSKADFGDPDDETFPIMTQADVDSASHLIGKAKPGVKERIIAIAKRKGLSIPDAWKEQKAAAAGTMKARIKALLSKKDIPILRFLDDVVDESADADPDDTAELISYEAMRSIMMQAQASLEEGVKHIDLLVAGETSDPKDDIDEIEEARLEAIIAMCSQLYGTVNGVMKIAFACLAPDDAMTPAMVGYAAHRAAIGKEISAKNQKTIQAAHDAAHDAHDAMTAMGADCPGDLKAAAAKPCGCGQRAATEGVEVTMTKEGRALIIKSLTENKDSGFTKDDVPMLEAMTDARLEALDTTTKAGLRTLAATKADAEKVIKDKADADKALAAHADMLKQRDSKKNEDDDEEGDSEDVKAAKAKRRTLKAAATLGMTVEQINELKTLAANKKAEDEKEHADLVAKLKTASSALTEEQLKAKSLDELRTLAKFAKLDVKDFSARGIPVAPRAAGAGDAAADFKAPDPWAPALEQRAAAKK